MKQPGEQLECPYCGSDHTVQEEEGGFGPDIDVRKFYVECPSLDGKINWAVIAD